MEYKVNILENFLSNEERKYLINFIENDKNYEYSVDTRRMFLNSETEEIKSILLKLQSHVRELYNSSELYVTEYLLNYYTAGFEMVVHDDLHSGKEHFKVSIVLYPGGEFTGGDIIFPNINFKYSPKAGDAVIFLSAPKEFEHGVELVTSGKRYVMPVWITDQKNKALDFINN
jgi:Rps23 Pro-64 3,4-dihydroxylase Tpa1-like proline 4-hydroxylase